MQFESNKRVLPRRQTHNVLESSIDKRIRPYLSSWEDAYKTVPPWDIGRPQPAFVELVRAMELDKGRVLDVGCGTGENALYLADNGFSVSGVDLSDRAIAAGRAKAKERRLKVDFRAGNALSLDFKDKVFDNVIDSGLFHTFTDYDRPVFAREIARVLVTNGRYFMLCFSEKEPTNWGGPRRITKKEIETTFSMLFRINYVRDASFATRIHNNGGKAYLTSATKIPSWPVNCFLNSPRKTVRAHRIFAFILRSSAQDAVPDFVRDYFLLVWYRRRTTPELNVFVSTSFRLALLASVKRRFPFPRIIG